MTNLQTRIFLPSLFMQLFIALAISQHALSQEIQTVARPPATADAKAAAHVDAKATTDKETFKDEACEHSPRAAAAAGNPASIERIGASRKAVTSAAAAQPSLFTAPNELDTAAARSFAFDASSTPALKSFDGPPVRPQSKLPGDQQTDATAAVTPLTPNEKMRRAFKSAFVSPRNYLLSGVNAILTESGEDDLPHKDTEDRIADGLSRFAIIFGRRSTNTLLTSGVYASLFKQDPRYYRSESKNFGARALYAASRVFVTRGDNGKFQPNYSRFAGQLSSSALSNLWEQSTPGHDRIGTDATFRRFGNSFISGAVINMLTEFLPDIKKIFGN